MKKIISILATVCLMFSLVGCAKVINTEYQEVEVKVVDSYHRAMWIQPVRAGKVTTYVTHPAVYKITVEYNGVEYSVSGSDTYNKYKNCIGSTTTGTLEINTYDDGTIKYDITKLQ